MLKVYPLVLPYKNSNIIPIENNSLLTENNIYKTITTMWEVYEESCS